MMKPAEFEDLKADILRNGLLTPVYLFNGEIVDGRNRYLACRAVGIKPKFQQFTGTESELLPFVVSLNIQRRHLNQSQKACLALELLPELERLNKANLSSKISAIRKGELSTNLTKPADSRKTAAQSFGVSEGAISTAKRIKEKSGELFEQVKSGAMKLNAAAKLLTFEKDNDLQNPPELSTNLTKPDNVELTRNEEKKIIELCTEFGISAAAARAYVLKKRTPKRTKTGKNYQELKVRFPDEMKEHLRSLAAADGVSISEYIRVMIAKHTAKNN